MNARAIIRGQTRDYRKSAREACSKAEKCFLKAGSNIGERLGASARRNIAGLQRVEFSSIFRFPRPDAPVSACDVADLETRKRITRARIS
jgi:hypothetical protein